MTRQEIENKIKNGESLSEADLSGLDLSGAQLGGANLEEVNLETANLSKANLSGANLINANLGRANLSGALLEAAILEGSNLRNADLSGADLTQSQFSEAYLGGAFLGKITAKKTNFQGCYLGGADLSDARFLGVNLESADLEKTDLRNSLLQDCRFDGANLKAAKVAGTIFEGIIGDGISSQEMDFSPQGDGSQIRVFSAEELGKITSPLSPPTPSGEEKVSDSFESFSPPLEETVQLSQEPGESPEKIVKTSASPPPPVPEIESDQKMPPVDSPPVQPTLGETPSEPPPEKKRASFEKKLNGAFRSPEIKMFIGKAVTEEGMAGIALYMTKVKELFGDTNIALKDFSNKRGECLLTFTTDNDSDLFVAVFLLLHFFKFSYEVELKELFNLLRETKCLQPGELDGMPVLDFWSLLPKFIKFPQAAFGFAAFKKEDLKILEIILSTGQGINVFFQGEKLQVDYETVPYNISFTINIKDQLLRPIPHQKGKEITELLHNLLLAVGTDDSMESYNKETACFALSRFLNEITENVSSPTLSPAAYYFWNIFWGQIRSNHSIAGAARSFGEYYPSLKIIMV